jgi:hypothetical protein
MIEDMAARKLNPNTQRSHIYSCKRFAAWLKRSPDTATPDEVRGFQLHLVESGTSICNRNRIMTGVRFLFRVTLRRHDLAAEVWRILQSNTSSLRHRLYQPDRDGAKSSLTLSIFSGEDHSRAKNAVSA